MNRTDQAATDQARRRYFARLHDVLGSIEDQARHELQVLITGRPSAARDAAAPMTARDFDTLTQRLGQLDAHRRAVRAGQPSPVAPPAPKPEADPVAKVNERLAAYSGSFDIGF